MPANSEGFQTVQTYFDNFRSGIDRCRTATAFDAADWQDAYARLARLRDRYLAERTNLKSSERKALFKVFEDDPFTKGMMEIRQVAEHAERRDSFTIRTTANAPITLDSDSSAMAVFSASIPTLIDSDGQPHRLDHLQMLEEMAKRIAVAMAKARP